MKKQCKSCKTEIDAKAKKCPQCRADQRNFFMRHKIMTGILVIVVIIIVASASGSKNSTASSSTAATESTVAQTAKTAKIGETIADGDLEFTLQAVDTTQTVGNSFSQKSAQGIYDILTVKIQNNGKDTKTINASNFTLVDDKGRKFDYSTDGQTAMEMTSGTTSFFLQQIQPGLAVTGKIIFDVPATATGLKLMAQGSLFGTPVAIDLGK